MKSYPIERFTLMISSRNIWNIKKKREERKRRIKKINLLFEARLEAPTIWTKEDAMQGAERERKRRKGYARVKATDRPRPKTTSIYHGVNRVTVPGT